MSDVIVRQLHEVQQEQEGVRLVVGFVKNNFEDLVEMLNPALISVLLQG